MPVHPSNRQGSALLIVLGFLSFMVVSAVSFAVFMRAERAPSSALRRGSATRYLVKAALAQAISCVDDAIHGAPSPRNLPAGVLRNTTDFEKFLNDAMNQPGTDCYRDRLGNPMDLWVGRVFMPPDPDGTTVRSDPKTRFAPIYDTVSVLNLEGLGYLPPPLLNDVRFFSRCSWSAKWQNFPYDAGRFAYVAVNVSDYFDINEVSARPRNSSEDGRISLAPLLVRGGAGSEEIDPSVVNRFVQMAQGARPSGSDGFASGQTPFVSMMDYNLALGNSPVGSYYSPFFRRINNQNAAAKFCEEADTNIIARQLFVTDSWFPSASTNDPTRNLLGEKGNNGQPFDGDDRLQKGGWKVTAEQVGNWMGKSFFPVVFDQHSQLFHGTKDRLALQDYLDTDDVPLSLVVPDIERNPMLAAAKPGVEGSLQVKMQKTTVKTPDGGEGGGYTKETTYTATFVGNLKPRFEALYLFPFRTGEFGSDIVSRFTSRSLVRMFFMMGADANGQPANPPRLRNSTALTSLRPSRNDWDAVTPFSCNGTSAFVFNYLSGSQDLTPPSFSIGDGDLEQEAFMNNGPCSYQFNRADEKIEGKKFFEKKVTQHYDKNDKATGDAAYSLTFPDGCVPFASDGTLMPATIEGKVAVEAFDNGALCPYLAFWVKVWKEDDANQVVDYVPAMAEDDMLLRGVESGATMLDSINEINSGSRLGTPLMGRRYGAQPFKIADLYTQADAQGDTADIQVPLTGIEQDGNWKPQGSFYAPDPRYNWAPEDWLPVTKGCNGNEWLQWVHDNFLGQGGRQPDIFQQVSDQGYLQSIGELAMLPQQGAGSVQISNYGELAPQELGLETHVDDVNVNLAHKSVYWMLHPIDYKYDPDNDDDKKLFKMGFYSGTKGFRVSPFTESSEVMRSVVELTPCDWWAAGVTNMTSILPAGYDTTDGAVQESKRIKERMLENIDEFKKYAYCKGSKFADMPSELAGKLASALVEKFRVYLRKNANDWERAYDEMWYDDEQTGNDNELFGVALNGISLYDVDRRFLYAYWRGCFANKQQLFLIFVRAESNALGGPGEGTPSQQGGRAVALVWRDPNPENPSDDRDGGNLFYERRRPHRTRILFYHQFE